MTFTLRQPCCYTCQARIPQMYQGAHISATPSTFFELPVSRHSLKRYETSSMSHQLQPGFWNVRRKIQSALDRYCMSEYKTANLYFVMGTHLFVLGNMTFMKGTHQSQHKGAMSILAALALMFGNKALSGDEDLGFGQCKTNNSRISECKAIEVERGVHVTSMVQPRVERLPTYTP